MKKIIKQSLEKQKVKFNFFTKLLIHSIIVFKKIFYSYLNTIIFFIVLGTVFVIFSGCSMERPGMEQSHTGSLFLKITSNDTTVSSYNIKLKGPGNQVINTNTEKDGIIAIDDLMVGFWSISVIAIDTRNIAIGSKKDTTEIFKSQVVIHEIRIATEADIKGWELDETNTGLAGAGIDRDSLELYNGTVYSGSYHEPPSGTVISLKKIVYPLSLRNGNIILDRCWIQPLHLLPGGLIITYNYNNLEPASDISYIYDCDIDASQLELTLSLAGACAVRGLATVKRCNIYSMGSGIAVFAYGLDENVDIERNYVHDLRAYGDVITGSHNESFTVRGFSGTKCLIKNNKFICKTGNDSGAIFIQSYAGNINNLHIEGNYLETSNWGIIAGNYGSYTYNNIDIINNRFVAGGYGAATVDSGVGWNTFTENYYYDLGSGDHKGITITQ